MILKYCLVLGIGLALLDHGVYELIKGVGYGVSLALTYLAISATTDALSEVKNIKYPT